MTCEFDIIALLGFVRQTGTVNSISIDLEESAKAPKRDWFSYIAQGNPDKTAVCDGTWKLVVLGGSVLDVKLDKATLPGDSEKKPSVELFRLDRDPGEQTNLAAEHPETVAKLLKRLKEFRSLKIDGLPDYRQGRKGFKAPKDWVIKKE